MNKLLVQINNIYNRKELMKKLISDLNKVKINKPTEHKQEHVGEYIYFMQSTEKPQLGPKKKNKGYTIDVESMEPCKYRNKCTRKRWWVGEYFQGGDIGKSINNKPKIHWHIEFGAQWTDDNGTIPFTHIY